MKLKLKDISSDLVDHLAQRVPACVHEYTEVGRCAQFRLVPDTSGRHEPMKDGRRDIWPYQRRSSNMFSTERKVHALCFHGYTKFMILAFFHDENAVFKTTFGRITKHNLTDMIWTIGTRNIGAPIAPVQFREACFCIDTGWYADYEATERAWHEKQK